MEWIQTRLSYLLEKNDSGVWGPEDKNLGLSILRSTNFTNEGSLDFSEITYRIVDERIVDDKTLKKGDILLERSGGSPTQPIGRVCYFELENQNHLFGNFISRLRTINKICLSKFLFWYLFYFHKSGKTFPLIKKTTGIQNLNYKLYLNTLIPLPPLSEQRRIVEILNQADEIRKLRKQANEKAEKIIPALFYEMFGDPTLNPKKYKIVELGSVTLDKPQYGINAGSTNYLEGSPRYIRITDVNNLGELNDIKVGVDYPNWKDYLLKWSDILFARSGATVGKTYLYKPEDGHCVFAGYMIKFSLDQNKINPWFAFYLTKTSHYENWVNSKRRAAAQPNINSKEYSSFTFPLPDLDEQNYFAEKALKVRSTLKSFSKSELKINSLFELLLSKAFDGSLTASWREANMKELLKEIEEQKKYLEGKINA